MNSDEEDAAANAAPVRDRAATRLPSNPVARILVVPLMPLVLTWELLYALVTRGIPALGRALLVLGGWIRVPLQALWDIGAAIARMLGRGLRAVFTALRAVAVRIGMAVRAFVRAIWHGARACGTALKAFAVRVFVAIRAAAKVLVRLLRGFGLAVVAWLKRMYMALRHVVGLAVRGLLAVCRRAAALLRALLTPVLRGLVAMGHRVGAFLAQVARAVFGVARKVGAWLALAGAWVWRIVSALVSTCADAVWRLGAALGLRLQLLGTSVWSITSLLIRAMDQVMHQVFAWITSGATRLMRTLARGLGRILRPLRQCIVRAAHNVVALIRIVGTGWARLCRGCWKWVAAIATMAGRLCAPLAQGVAMLGRWTVNLVAALAHACAVAIRYLRSALRLRLRLLVDSAWLITSFLARTLGKTLRWVGSLAIKLARALTRALTRALVRPLVRATTLAMVFVRGAILRALRFLIGMAKAVLDALKWGMLGMRSLVMPVGRVLRQVRLSVVATLRAVRTTLSDFSGAMPRRQINHADEDKTK